MIVNIKKTEAMVISNRNFVGPSLPVKIANNMIEYIEECKLLGVVIDRQLK